VSGKVDLDGYVQVKDRIRLFYEAHPDGRLVTAEVKWPHPDDDVQRVAVKALAYRTADDPQPAVGWSWMVVPGATNFTRGSELENTETSAWGRAIGSLGIGIDKSIASTDEVKSKESDSEAPGSTPPAREPSQPTYVSQGAKSYAGKVAKGHGSFNDVAYYQDPEGHRIGFRLEMADGKAIHEVLVGGALGEAMYVTVPVKELLASDVTVDGEAFRIDQPGRRARSRLVVTRIRGADFEIPAPDGAVTAPVVDSGKVDDLDQLPF
jgi:hypothetical protein